MPCGIPRMAFPAPYQGDFKHRESEFPPTRIAISSRQSAIGKRRESEFPPTRIAISSRQSAIGKRRESEFPPTGKRNTPITYTKNMTFFHRRDILSPNVLLADAHGAAGYRCQVRAVRIVANGIHYI